MPALGQGELLEEVLVDAAEHVGGAGICPTELDVAHQVYHLSQASLVQRGAGVVFGQHVLQCRVVTLDGGHCVVDRPSYGGLSRLGLDVGPTRLGRHPEDALGAVFVRVFGICTVGDLVLQPGVGLLECVGDVLEEDEAEDDVLVLGGVHTAAQGVRHGP